MTQGHRRRQGIDEEFEGLRYYTFNPECGQRRRILGNPSRWNRASEARNVNGHVHFQYFDGLPIRRGLSCHGLRSVRSVKETDSNLIQSSRRLIKLWFYLGTSPQVPNIAQGPILNGHQAQEVESSQPLINNTNRMPSVQTLFVVISSSHLIDWCSFPTAYFWGFSIRHSQNVWKQLESCMSSMFMYERLIFCAD